jgi:hypothetical protein
MHKNTEETSPQALVLFNYLDSRGRSLAWDRPNAVDGEGRSGRTVAVRGTSDVALLGDRTQWLGAICLHAATWPLLT